MKLPPLILVTLSLLLQACGDSDNPDSVTSNLPVNSSIDQVSSVSSHVNPSHSGYPKNVYFGDTHVHTDLSLDAGAFGNRLGLAEAYRFARGDEVNSSTGLKAKLHKPLDFIVIADHSDAMGIFPDLLDSRGDIMNTVEGKKWAKMLAAGKGYEAARDMISMFSQGELSFKTNDPKILEPVWESAVNTAEEYNNPGVFTALIGYEWTSLIKGNNLHRVVIFRDGANKVVQHLPYTNEDSSDPEMLWQNLAAYEAKTGGRVLAIPHNGNLSNGMMFMEQTISGQPFDKDYAQRRAKWEPLYEVTQIKGDSEAHPFLSPNDEFSDYENWDSGNLDFSEKKSNDMLEYEYGRSGLKLGLKIKHRLGVNPYKYGLIGSTDSHTSLATADDNNFFGKTSTAEPSASRANQKYKESNVGTIMTWEAIASGYAAVWAHKNTRSSLFDAMARKETYATTGSRMTIRFFAGDDFTDADLNGDFVAAGYQRGVPMGGDLKMVNNEPTFIVAAMQDPDGGSLDRVQIVKGWTTKEGALEEKVYDVVWSGERKKDANGKVPSVGNSVNLADASWDNSIGSSQLEAVWVDPEFNAQQDAFYYVRVIEIPTPRWTLYDKLRFGSKLSENVPLVTTQRGYTSPIWYTAHD